MPQVAYGVYNGLAPINGPKAINIVLDFEAALAIDYDLVKEQDADNINFIQSAWIDNSLSARRLDIEINGIPMRLSVGAGVMGMFPIIHPGHFKAKFSVSAVHAVKIPVVLLNVPQPYFYMIPGAA